MGQFSFSKSHHCINTNVVCKAVKNSASGQMNGLTTKILFSNQMSVDKIQRHDFKFTTLLRGQFIHGGEIFSTRTIELRTKIRKDFLTADIE